VSDDPELDELRRRARSLVEDLNLTTMGWKLPSDRLIEDFAAGEHRLRAEEHELTDRDRSGGRRVFSLYPLEVDAGEPPLVGLLVEPETGGPWRLLVPDRS
jgi:hypothetical protein